MMGIAYFIHLFAINNMIIKIFVFFSMNMSYIGTLYYVLYGTTYAFLLLQKVMGNVQGWDTFNVQTKI